MTRLFVLLAALILYLAPPVAQAFATSHVRPPGAALVQPTSADTEGTSLPEPVGYWTRIVDSVVNDPRAVATIIAAFLGFLFGVLIKFLLDQLADYFRRGTDRRFLAAALWAELVGIDADCDGSIKSFGKLLNEKPKKEVFGGPHSFARLALPPRRVWMAQVGRIGVLGGVNPTTLILVHSLFDSYDLDVKTAEQLAGGQGVPREVLEHLVAALEKMRKAIWKAGTALSEQKLVGPSWWRRYRASRGIRKLRQVPQ